VTSEQLTEIRYPKMISEDDWLVPIRHTPNVNRFSAHGTHWTHRYRPTLRPSPSPISHRLKSTPRTTNAHQVTQDPPRARRRSRMYSGRLHNSDPILRGKVFKCHHKFAHACEDIMVHALTPQGAAQLPYWRNTTSHPTKCALSSVTNHAYYAS
jgi:hypothetical protein